MYTLFIIVNSACMTTITFVVVTCYIFIYVTGTVKLAYSEFLGTPVKTSL